MSALPIESASTLRSSEWIQTYGSSESAPLRLFCFPYVGGAASVFRHWPSRFNHRVETLAVQLPGRENRMSERAIGDLHALVRAIADEIESSLHEKPFAFFGHSLGGIVAFELARELRRRGLPQPLRLFVSACSAPQVADYSDPPRHLMSDEELIAELRELGGTPEELLRNEELLAILLPTLRADFSLFDTYRYTGGAPLEIPISAFGGLEDFALPEEKLEGWQLQTAAAFTLRMFPGGHFFLHPYEQALTRELERLLG
jgi:medium-chain acyl-[acyl-carrier-protein] hydrolase